MIDKPSLLSLIDYSQWADELLSNAASKLNDEELRRPLGVSHGSVLETLQHIFYADRVWLARLQGESPAGYGSPPHSTFEGFRQEWRDVIDGLKQFVQSLSGEQLASELHTKRINGDPVVLPRWQVVLHVVNHATLHRGQVVAMLRQLGYPAPATDLLFFYLENQKSAVTSWG